MAAMGMPLFRDPIIYVKDGAPRVPQDGDIVLAAGRHQRAAPYMRAKRQCYRAENKP